MRNRYLVAYDISDAGRLRTVFQTMRGFGDSLQYSVFSCDLSAKERVMLEEALTTVINVREDRVLIVDTGPAEARGTKAIRALGRQDIPASAEVMVI